MTVEDKALAMSRLLHNQDFNDLFMVGFIDQGILDIALRDNVSSVAVQDMLKARKILNDYIYGIINDAEIAKIENKE